MSTGLSAEANDLCLWVLNTGELYAQLCAARGAVLDGQWDDETRGGLHHSAKLAFSGTVRTGVEGYARCFPDHPGFDTDTRLRVCDYLLDQTVASEDYAHCKLNN